MGKIVVLGALDTKGNEFLYLKRKIQELGGETLVIDTSVGGPPVFSGDITSDEVLGKIGLTKEEVQRMGRRDAVEAMRKSAVITVGELLTTGSINGIITMCGGTGSTVANGVYDSLPFGFAKVMLSTLPPLTGEKDKLSLNDTLFMQSIVDVAGLNEVMTRQMDEIASAIVSMVRNTTFDRHKIKQEESPKVALTMFGVTTPCVSEVQRILVDKGYDAIVFHANGDGGFQMEKLIKQGFFDGVIDITTAEIVPGFFEGAIGYAGDTRLEAAGEAGIPCLFVPGALDVANYTDMEAAKKYNDRKSHMHVPGLKVIRPNKYDSIKIAERLAEKINKSTSAAEVVIPLRGISQTDIKGHECYDQEADNALFDTLKNNLKPEVRVTDVDFHINDREFAQTVARIFMDRVLPIK